MLIDLELPAGAIGARLQLAGGPNVRMLLQDTGEPVTREAIGRVAQRVHFGLEVIPAPFTPSALGHDAPDARRLADMLDVLTTAGYYVVLHLNVRPDEVTAAALRRSFRRRRPQVGFDDAAHQRIGLALLGRVLRLDGRRCRCRCP